MSMYKTREILCVRYVCAPQAAKWCAQPTQMHARGTMKIARDCFVCRGGLLPPLEGGEFLFFFPGTVTKTPQCSDLVKTDLTER